MPSFFWNIGKPIYLLSVTIEKCRVIFVISFLRLYKKGICKKTNKQTKKKPDCSDLNLFCHFHGPQIDWKGRKMRKRFAIIKKFWNFEHTGKVCEFYLKREGLLEIFSVIFLRIFFSCHAYPGGVLSGCPIWGKLVCHSLYL